MTPKQSFAQAWADAKVGLDSAPPLLKPPAMGKRTIKTPHNSLHVFWLRRVQISLTRAGGPRPFASITIRLNGRSR